MPTASGFTSADYKVAGGKLLRVRLRAADGVIQAITLTGDFFMHPEEAIEDLEARLTGAPLIEAALRAQVDAFFAADVQVIGADAADIVHVILLAATS